MSYFIWFTKGLHGKSRPKYDTVLFLCFCIYRMFVFLCRHL